MKRFLHGRNLLYLGVGSAARGDRDRADPRQRDRVVERGDARRPSPTTTTTATGESDARARPKAPGAAATAALFRGIPQQLNQLGNPKAKVTMIEFADPQCPYCREYDARRAAGDRQGVRPARAR